MTQIGARVSLRHLSQCANLALMDTTKLLTAEQVGEQHHLSGSQINRLAAEGKLPIAIQFPGYNGARLFDPDQVADFFANRYAAI